MIEVQNLQKAFKKHAVLTGLDLQVQKGEVYGFLGLNGAGKTTTMNILAGLSAFDSGRCTVNSINLSPGTRSCLPDTAYLPENPAFYPFMTGREYLAYTANLKRLPQKQAAKRVDEMLAVSGLQGAANRRIGGYSRGMRQRLGMGAALLHRPKLIFLDEPTSALDPEGRQAVLQIILGLKSQGCTAFLSTHLLDDAEKVCDRVGILRAGRLALTDSLTNLRQTHIKPAADVALSRMPSAEEMHALKGVAGIRKIESGTNSLAVFMQSDAAGEALLQKLLDLRLGVLSFVRRSANLQEIFMETNGEA